MAVLSPLIVPDVPIWRLSVAQYHELIHAGVLKDDDPVELLEGWLVTKMPKNRTHSLATQLTREALAHMVLPGWYVDAQEPITTPDSEPETGVMVVRGDRRDFVDKHPAAEAVELVVEVADTTLKRDRTIKLRLYATARIPIYWILNLNERQLEVNISPLGEGDQSRYQRLVVYHERDEVPVVIGGHEVGLLPVRDLLP